MDDTTRYRHKSLWFDQMAETDDLTPRPGLDGDARFDVAIVGAGFTGLWTAYYLARRSPDLEICIIDSEIAGFGASGRNGGWCSGEFAMRPDRFAPDMIRRTYQAIWQAIDEVGRVVAEEGIQCDFEKGGSLTLATSNPQKHRLRAELMWFRSLGFDEMDHRWLPPSNLSKRLISDKALGAVYTPHCAAIQPARLARGLAEVVEQLGVTVLEHTSATALEPGVVRTETGRLYARIVVDCTEAFASQLPGRSRDRIPIYSLMVATEPLTGDVWSAIGLGNRETFADARHNVIYGQRTGDDRIAFGGRGAPYAFGSAMPQSLERDHRTHHAIVDVLRWLVPQVGDAAITHTWGGAVGVSRDFTASVHWDADTGMGSAGGYVGAGVSASNVAGRTLADLITNTRSELTALGWVGHQSPRWEAEPLRWLGVNAGRKLAQTADAREFASDRPSRAASAVVHRLTGH